MCISVGFQLNFFAEAQNFGDCDFYKEIKPGVVYSFTSPNYKDRYDPGTLCRYTGSLTCVKTQIILLSFLVLFSK